MSAPTAPHEPPGDRQIRLAEELQYARQLVRRWLTLAEERVVTEARVQALRDLKAECRRLPWLEREEEPEQEPEEVYHEMACAKCHPGDGKRRRPLIFMKHQGGNVYRCSVCGFSVRLVPPGQKHP